MITYDGCAVLDAGRVVILSQQKNKQVIVSSDGTGTEIISELDSVAIGKFTNGAFLLISDNTQKGNIQSDDRSFVMSSFDSNGTIIAKQLA